MTSSPATTHPQRGQATRVETLLDYGPSEPEPPLSAAMTTVGGWIWAANVPTLMTYLSMYCNYSWGDLDAEAVDVGVRTSDVDQDGWYEYPLAGTPPLRVELSQHVGGGGPRVRHRGMDAVRAARVDTLVSVLAEVG